MRAEREANLKLASKTGLFGSKKEDFAAEYKLQAMQSLVNSLTETVTEKETAVTNMRATNQALGQRVLELEELLRTTRGSTDRKASSHAS